MTKAQAVLVQNPEWQAAVQAVTEQLTDFGSIDLLVVFAGASYRAFYAEMVQELYQKSGAKVLVGCSGQGIIGQEQEIEKNQAALSVLALSLPGAELRPILITDEILQNSGAVGLPQQLGIQPSDTNAWILLADPFNLDAEALLKTLTEYYPGRPLIGGMASASPRLRQTYLFFNNQVLTEGAVALAVGGKYTLQPVVSQGATPIGEAWMVTQADKNLIYTISGRPAFEVLLDTIKDLPPDLLEKARRNLLVGLAVDEYKSDFGRGDYIIRSLMGADQKSGVIALNDFPRIGQTIQFQLRDADAADEDLRELLTATKTRLGDNQPLAGVLFACNGRGLNMFPEPDHDAKSIAAQFSAMPLVGFFCNGEIGPIGPKPFLHGFTASLGLFVEK